MLKLKKMLHRLSFVLRPKFWHRIRPYSAEWDAALNRMLDKPVFEGKSGHVIRLNGKTIWVSNWPYAYGTPYGWAREVVPSRATQVRLRKAHEAFAFNNFDFESIE